MVLSILSRVLMALSPHDPEKLDQNTEDIKARIQAREDTRERVVQRNRDYIDLQMDIMKRRP